MHQLTRFSIAGSLASAATALGIVAPGSVAHAGPQPIQIAETQGMGVNLRSMPSTNSQIIGKIPEGESPDYECFKFGQDVGGTDLWFRVNYEGQQGFYSAFYDSTPYEWRHYIWNHYGIGECDKPTPGSRADESYARDRVPLRYDGQAAANWALAHAQDDQPGVNLPACTIFASRALTAGGMYFDDRWNNLPQYTSVKRQLRQVEGTVVWSSANDMYEWLQTREGVSIKRTNFTENAMPEARVGDIIAYWWDGVGDKNPKPADHLAVVVNIAPGQYPEVAEWGTNPNWQARSSYQKRGWTWSAKDGTWLQVHNQDIVAKLIHFGS